MALKDLIRQVHGPNELIPSIDMFLMKKEPDYREPGWHPSDFCGMCPRSRALQILTGYREKSWKSKAGRQRIFDFGTAIHSWYQNHYLGPMGILWGRWKDLATGIVVWGFQPKPREGRVWNYEEVPVSASVPGSDKKIVGHSDGLLVMNRTCATFELKTINERGFKSLVRPVYNADKQAGIYCELIRQGHTRAPKSVDVPKPTKVLILYVGKNTSEEKEFWLNHDEEAAREELKKPYLFEESFKTRTLADRKPECTNLLAESAKRCPVSSYCFGSLSWNDLECIGGSNG